MKEQGFALVHVMMLCSVVAILAVAALSRGASLALDNRAERARLRAHYAAEGGLAIARQALRQEARFESKDLQVGAGAVRVEVRRIEPGQWEIVARAAVTTRGAEQVVVTLREGFGARYWLRAR